MRFLEGWVNSALSQELELHSNLLQMKLGLLMSSVLLLGISASTSLVYYYTPVTARLTDERSRVKSLDHLVIR